MHKGRSDRTFSQILEPLSRFTVVTGVYCWFVFCWFFCLRL